MLITDKIIELKKRLEFEILKSELNNINNERVISIIQELDKLTVEYMKNLDGI